MNKISAFFFWLALLPARFYEQMGANRAQLAMILRYKLIMDDRRPNTFQQTQVKRKKEGVSRATYGTMLIALFMGLLNLIAFAMGADDITHFTIYFSFFLFLLSATLISDFTSVLIDPRDTQILLPKPVNDRTFLLARILHIMVHLFRVILPMLLPAIVYLAIEYNVVVVARFLISAALASLMAIFFINALYLLIIRVTTPERFKSIIAWFQIGFMILIYGAYQVMPRATAMENLQQFTVSDYWYSWLLPPYWFAASVVHAWWWILISASASLLGVWVVIRYLAPRFNQKLAMLGGSSETMASQKKSAASPAGKTGYAKRLAIVVTRESVERAGFLFTWKWALRNRGFRMRVYPAIGYILVWFAISIYRNVFQMGESGETGLKGSAAGLLGLIYLSCFIFISAIQQISQADEYKAAWIFYSAPVAAPGPILLGMLKALLAQFFLPLAIVVSALGFAWQGWEVLPNLLLGFSNMLLISGLLLLINYKKLPASLPANKADATGNFLRGLLMLLFTGGFGMIHYFIYLFPLVVSMSVLLSAIAVCLVYRRISRITWKELAEN